MHYGVGENGQFSKTTTDMKAELLSLRESS